MTDRRGPPLEPDAEGPTDDNVGRSALFTYAAPFIGVLLVAVGIGAAVPGVYDLIQEDITTCDAPTIAVESPTETGERFEGEGAPNITRLDYADLSPAEQAAFERALAEPVGEAYLQGPSPHRPQFGNGTIVTYEGNPYYVTIVAENPCFEAAPLQFPLGVFAIALGVLGILTPPAYRRLVTLEESMRHGES
jgi:hypothetical protein